jgi:hypothetical protein
MPVATVSIPLCLVSPPPLMQDERPFTPPMRGEDAFILHTVQTGAHAARISPPRGVDATPRVPR